MAKTVEDITHLVSAVLSAAKSPRTIKVNFDKEWADYKIGFVDLSKWRLLSSSPPQRSIVAKLYV